MLKPKQIDALPQALVELYSQVEMDILADMARRISAMDFFIPAAQWQYRKLAEMGNCHGWIMQALSAQTGKSRREIERMMEEAGVKAYRQDAAIYKRAGLSPPELAASPALQAVINDGIRNTEGLFENLTGTTADTATKQFERALDRAWLQVQSGGFSQEEAVRMAVKDLSAAGVESIVYPSGHVDHMDVAVRRAAVTGANQAALRLQDSLAEEMDSDLVEVTAHAGARTGKGVANHAGWQGKVYSRSGNSQKYPSLVEATGYGTGAGLGGWNCRHSHFPFFEGLSDPAYTAAELEEMNAQKVTYNGEKLTEYEASQKQRAIERHIRRWKREYKAMEAAGLDTAEAAGKLAGWQKTQRDFLEQTGLKRQAERERVEGFGRAEAAKATRMAGEKKSHASQSVEKNQKSGIIKMGRDTMGIDIQIDELTPCLVEVETGNVLQTAYRQVDRQELKGLKRKGWLFDWTDSDLDGDEIYKLTLSGDEEIQGLIALRYEERSRAVYAHLAESAPHNRGTHKRYKGVGGHLFAVAARKSLDRGYGGYVFLDAKNMELVRHYQKEIGAFLLGMPHPYRMVLDEEAAARLLDKYTL